MSHHGAVLSLRMARPGDGHALAVIYAPVVRDTAVSFEATPPTADAMAGRVEATLATHPWLVAERGDALVGYAYASPHRTRPAYRWSAETSVYVHRDARRKGVARRLYGALLAQLELLGFATALAGVTVPNEASVALHRALGFTRVGLYRRVGFKRGAWHDVLWLERALGEPGHPPREPATPAALAGTDAWAATFTRGRP